jgi:hypothetical protein
MPEADLVVSVTDIRDRIYNNIAGGIWGRRGHDRMVVGFYNYLCN